MNKIVRLPGLWALIGLIIAATLIQQLPGSFELLNYQPALIREGQWWRFVTGNWIHTNDWHLGLDLGGLLVIWLLFAEVLPGARMVWVLLLGSLATSVGLWFFSPQVIWYAGLSGTLHGLYFFAALLTLPRDKRLAIPLLIAGVLKVSWDLYSGGSTLSAELIDAPVMTPAHLYGAVSGLICALLWLPHQIAANRQREM
ncbi:rhombosortase [Dongshaea marina]|uniref:rhombosortase n=1 Tax=Dongshaea marina TaxID=2047966 RepID=UPI000D3E924B|nr:rhombosortase [Dongshaea marina]